jgi:FlaA1/EpsC-like NDP-sugar epimerase
MYGIDTNSVGLANMLNNNIQSTYRIVGFITSDPSTSNQRIMDLPVFYVQDGILAKIVHTYQIQALTFPTQDALLNERNNLVEACICLNIKIFLARSPKVWSENDTSGKKTPIPFDPFKLKTCWVGKKFRSTFLPLEKKSRTKSS